MDEPADLRKDGARFNATDSKAPAASSAHLVGIAGAGMKALASVLLARGWRVSGSDVNSAASPRLRGLGAVVYSGHAATNVPRDCRLLIYSDAVPPDNVERIRASALRIAATSYTQMLARLSREAVATLAVAGTHGKSTTVAMAGAALIHAGLDPTIVCGATPLGEATGGRAGGNNLFLVEACEYRANFLQLSPQIAVALGIEPDHFDFYKSRGQLIDAFEQFAARVAADGLLILNRDYPAARRLEKRANCRVATFGLRPGADWTAARRQIRRGRYRFVICHRGQPITQVALRVPGRHNVLNALAAAALASSGGAPAAAIGEALSAFRGLKRRLEVVGRRGGVTWIDDYAHHPTEVRASLGAVRRMYPGRRVCCVFQPHQASRTAALLDEFAESLHNCDKLAVAEIFRAREPTVRPGEVTAADLAAAVAARGNDVLDEHRPQRIAARLARELRPGDALITMGAGDIGKIGQTLYQRLRKDRARS